MESDLTLCSKGRRRDQDLWRNSIGMSIQLREALCNSASSEEGVSCWSSTSLRQANRFPIAQQKVAHRYRIVFYGKPVMQVDIVLHLASSIISNQTSLCSAMRLVQLRILLPIV